MRGMEKRIKQKSLKIYTSCILGRLPMQVQHPGSISKHRASPIYTQPFYTEENRDSFIQYLFLFYSVQTMSSISTARGTTRYFCTSKSHLCFSRCRRCSSRSPAARVPLRTSAGRGSKSGWAQNRAGVEQLPPLARVLIWNTCFLSAFPS